MYNLYTIRKITFDFRTLYCKSQSSVVQSVKELCNDFLRITFLRLIYYIGKGKPMNNILNLRKQYDISRLQLAQYMSMSQAALGRRERGEVPLSEDEICKIANFFKCPYEDIIGGNFKHEGK